LGGAAWGYAEVERKVRFSPLAIQEASSCCILGEAQERFA